MTAQYFQKEYLNAGKVTKNIALNADFPKLYGLDLHAARRINDYAERSLVLYFTEICQYSFHTLPGAFLWC